MDILILQDKQHISTLSLSIKLICNARKAVKGWFFYLILKLLQICVIFCDNVHILYIYVTTRTQTIVTPTLVLLNSA